MIKKVLMLVAPSKFRDEELFIPMEEFQRCGIEVDVTSKDRGESTGMLGGKVTIKRRYNEFVPLEYQALILVGGSGASVYFNDPLAFQLIDAFYKDKKIVAAICVAPVILANMGLLTNKNATCFSSESSILRQKGVYYTGDDITIEGRIITAKGPQVAKIFADTIIRALGVIRKEKM